MYFPPHLALNLIWPSSVPYCAICGMVRQQPLTSSGSAILSWPWENRHAWFSSFLEKCWGPSSTNMFFSTESPGRCFQWSHVTGPHGNLLTLPTAVSHYPQPFPTGSHTHWIRKVSLNTSVLSSGIPQRSNSCWPLFQTHDPVCPQK